MRLKQEIIDKNNKNRIKIANFTIIDYAKNTSAQQECKTIRSCIKALI